MPAQRERPRTALACRYPEPDRPKEAAMQSVPDQSRPHHHRAAPVTIDDLRRVSGGDWDTRWRPAGIPVVTAERRSPDGRHIRYLVTHSVGELAAKLDTASVVEP